MGLETGFRTHKKTDQILFFVAAWIERAFRWVVDELVFYFYSFFWGESENHCREVFFTYKFDQGD